MVTHLLFCHVFQSHPKQFCNLDSNVYEEHLRRTVDFVPCHLHATMDKILKENCQL